MGPIGRAHVAVAHNLADFIRGKAEPLELLTQTGILREYYAGLHKFRHAKHIVSFVDLLAHQNPGMDILEVGGGTGSGTCNIVNALASRGDRSGGPLRCHRYDFTDISASFVRQAKDYCCQFASQMTFGMLDIERDFEEQYYHTTRYDLVIAEAFDETGWLPGHIFGLFPGWWPNGDKERLSPNLMPDSWDILLRSNGFSGVEIVRDSETGADSAYHFGWLVSTANDEPSLVRQPDQLTTRVRLVIMGDSMDQTMVSYKLQCYLKDEAAMAATTVHLENASDLAHDDTETLNILLVDYDQSFLESLNYRKWKLLQLLVSNSRKLLWVTAGGGRQGAPEHGMPDGLARTLRLENYGLQLITIALEGSEFSPRKGQYLAKIIQEMGCRARYENYEQEYVEIDGFLHTRRLVPDTYLQSLLEQGYTPQMTPIRLHSDVPLLLSKPSPGADYSPYFVRRSLISKELRSNRFQSHSISSADACYLIPQIAVAYNALIEVGRVCLDDHILIQGGNTLVGRAAMKLLAAHHIKNFWMVVSDEDEYNWAMRNFPISQHRIILRTWFECKPVLVETLKFDVVFAAGEFLNSGPYVHHSFRGARYIAVHDPVSMDRHKKKSPVPTPPPGMTAVIINPVEVLLSPESIAYACREDMAQKDVILRFDGTEIVDAASEPTMAHKLDPEASYLISGGFGGLGRETARWVVKRGARYLILLSRSGPQGLESAKLIADLRNEGVHVETPECDISDRRALRTALNHCSKGMPQIKGCIQASMVMKESLFGELKYEDWQAVTNPKVKGSWNLHLELPRGLDFLVLLSSVMGILGTGMLSSYNAANTYQDALARFRVAQAGAYPFSDFCDILDYFCDPKAELSNSVTSCQTICGVARPEHWSREDAEQFTVGQPFWGHVRHATSWAFEDVENEDSHTTDTRSKKQTQRDIIDRLEAANSPTEAVHVATKSLAEYMSHLLGVPEESIDPLRTIESYGVDSLSIINIRNWISKIFSVDVSVFELLRTIERAAAMISERYTLRAKSNDVSAGM
ncbi:hypothetical protein JX265_009441 [Neoarthrinium moseri]|uniref:Carrier domain-containing protein n=1 Tax=Neoarthrinium moseri TaxID=1658444 RepID=A0A9Q0ALR3_9PEZI|nr:hypothetical protein JX266_012009 [Neoarthrinium moseri]KAI1861938.1 hypothetical protein JX265_009441 [Neoarthrinium moseri]